VKLVGLSVNCFCRRSGGNGWVHQLMTASMVHVTNLTPGSECNPSMAYGQTHRSMTAGMVQVTNLTPGSECNPTRWKKHQPPVFGGAVRVDSP
jgi:hypothetical protein